MNDSHERSSNFLSSGASYALAIVATVIALALTSATRRVSPDPVFLFFVVAVAVSVWFGSRGPGLLATALSVLFSKYFFKPPIGSLSLERSADVVPFVVFVIASLAIIWIIEALKRAKALAESRAVELERVNEQLRHALISRRLLAAQESERRRIARVLHEGVGQLLTAVRLNLQRLTSPDVPDTALVRDSVALIDETLKSVRDLSVELRPIVLDDLGLGQAVAWYANRQAERAGYAVAVDCALGDIRLPEQIETAGFRIVQQALTNVARHARATNVHITLDKDPQGIELAVTDDGTGFDVGDAKARAHAGASLGLVDMEELAYMAGGALTVTSTEGTGTIVRVRFAVDSVE